MLDCGRGENRRKFRGAQVGQGPAAPAMAGNEAMDKVAAQQTCRRAGSRSAFAPAAPALVAMGATTAPPYCQAARRN